MKITIVFIFPIFNQWRSFLSSEEKIVSNYMDTIITYLLLFRYSILKFESLPLKSLTKK